MAKVRFVPTANNGYTGLFASGSDHSLLRLSVTGDPADRGFAPGLAWKAFVDGQPSKNVSALYTLSGQGGNYNFFANELSQFVQTEANETLGTTILFSAVTLKPTLLRVDDMAKVKQDGSAVSSPKAPTQIYFVPRAEVKSRFASTPHDFREDLLSIEEGTKVYDVYATSTEIKTSIFPSLNQRYANERRSSARKIGEIELLRPSSPRPSATPVCSSSTSVTKTSNATGGTTSPGNAGAFLWAAFLGETRRLATWTGRSDFGRAAPTGARLQTAEPGEAPQPGRLHGSVGATSVASFWPGPA